jgi:hypothetical protein
MKQSSFLVIEKPPTPVENNNNHNVSSWNTLHHVSNEGTNVIDFQDIV